MGLPSFLLMLLYAFVITSISSILGIGGTTMTLTIGQNRYTNALPLFYYLDYVKLKDQSISFLEEVPVALNQMLAAGQLDIALISSFSYGLYADQYYLLPELSVSASREVASILLFSKIPIEELNHKKIALTDRSATSVALLEIILREFYQYENDYDVMTSDIMKCLKNMKPA
jgi:chorismate dehydratase